MAIIHTGLILFSFYPLQVFTSYTLSLIKEGSRNLTALRWLFDNRGSGSNTRYRVSISFSLNFPLLISVSALNERS